MTDIVTAKPIQVKRDHLGGGYIDLPYSQLESIKSLFTENQVPFWVDRFAISMDGKPATTTIFLRHKADLNKVQELLDAA